MNLTQEYQVLSVITSQIWHLQRRRSGQLGLEHVSRGKLVSFRLV